MHKRIITSLLDNDLYKMSMQQCVFHQYPNVVVEYEFRCRNKGLKLGFLAPMIRDEVDQWGDIELQPQEANFLHSTGFLQKDYIDYLKTFRFNPNLCQIDDINGDLVIKIKGLWLDTILFEVQLLATINELYFLETTVPECLIQEGKDRLIVKVEMLKKHPRLMISEFGTRRRYSREWQAYVFSVLKDLPNVVGSSNMQLAYLNNTKAIGTMAHEYISAHLGLVDRLETAQKRALHVWLQEYGTNLGTALTDTFTTPAFFRDFQHVLANSFSGVRHDSGDPIAFGNATINHYKSLGIDPRTKTIVFSDGLDIPECIRIFETFTGMIGLAFGVGTNLTNDLGPKPLNIVIKMVSCNGKPVVKLSDNAGKEIGDAQMLEDVKKAYQVNR